jgi:hypothetical protein
VNTAIGVGTFLAAVVRDRRAPVTVDVPALLHGLRRAGSVREG